MLSFSWWMGFRSESRYKRANRERMPPFPFRPERLEKSDQKRALQKKQSLSLKALALRSCCRFRGGWASGARADTKERTGKGCRHFLLGRRALKKPELNRLLGNTDGAFQVNGGLLGRRVVVRVNKSQGNPRRNIHARTTDIRISRGIINLLFQI